jgi:para-aminobenzoate synthetase component I
VLNWIKRFDTFCFLDSQGYASEPHTVECLCAAGVKRSITANGDEALGQMQSFIEAGNRWLFGHLCYDLKTEKNNAATIHPDGIRFPDLFFFEPETVLRLNQKELVIDSDDPKSIFDSINTAEAPANVRLTAKQKLQPRISKNEYLVIIEELRKHILRGDCYEINFCLEFYSEKMECDPAILYERLCAVSPNPFSALYRMGEKWLVCASPERFLKKQGSKVLSQPIKGTSQRVQADEKQDAESKQALFHSTKDRSENVMVVDLVRNDLSRVCEEGSVSVDELFGIYSFPQVHQMISTVSGTLRKNIKFSDIIKATFPMGSMTGAPKKKVMELINRYEKTKRGIFSGAVGYIDPWGDFDFNVVIRSLLYNSASQYLSFQVGSGITFYSDPEKEWEECMLKGKAIRSVLEQDETR